MRLVLHGGVLGRHAERVPSHRVDDVEALGPAVARHDVAHRVVAHVAHVDAPRRIREHLEHVILRPRVVVRWREKVPRVGPDGSANALRLRGRCSGRSTGCLGASVRMRMGSIARQRARVADAKSKCVTGARRCRQSVPCLARWAPVLDRRASEVYADSVRPGLAGRNAPADACGSRPWTPTSPVVNLHRRARPGSPAPPRTATRAPGSVARSWPCPRPTAPDAIAPVIAAGQRVFGENRVQEAKAKWPALRQATPGLELHLIGPLQSNKAREARRAVRRDRDRGPAQDRGGPRPMPWPGRGGRRPCLVQVNTGAEPQKAGVLPEDADAFIADCRDGSGLAVAGLMCIPPAGRAGLAPFRAVGHHRVAERPRPPVHGHERRFRARHPTRGHARAESAARSSVTGHAPPEPPAPLPPLVGLDAGPLRAPPHPDRTLRPFRAPLPSTGWSAPTAGAGVNVSVPPGPESPFGIPTLTPGVVI